MDPTDFTDVTGRTYTYLLNGLPPKANWNGLFRPSGKVRLRFIDAGAMRRGRSRRGGTGALIASRGASVPRERCSTWAWTCPAWREWRKRVDAGFNDVDLGLRLRYEVRREFAPYVGLSYRESFGATRSRVLREGGVPNELQVAGGVRMWFQRGPLE